VIDEFVDGVWFVELASIADPDAVDAATLGARPQSSGPATTRGPSPPTFRLACGPNATPGCGLRPR
jgi:hypothetical protein